MVTVPADRSHRRRTPPLGGSLAYLLLNFPIGVFSFALITALGSAGLGTVVVWIGVPLLALLLLFVRAAGRMERGRVFALLDVYIDDPYLPLPISGQKQRWLRRLKDPATWRDLGYLYLLFPLAVVEFVLVVTAWAVSLGLAALPVYYRFLPGGVYAFPSDDLRWFTVDSFVSALPWAALGVLFAAVSIALTKGLASMHAALATGMLRPTPAQRRRMERSWNEIDGMTVAG
ncbi:sensor domain-containing protein [Amycolatopsis benzoatilytica]|uniref:sensor domain-containing protein n=1 Tax=Amycolatopsis benzoatilytica TaxID=346045 RepID=UPI000382CCF1|nr:sensor domain-containing protein [Amycolatopsis benzoatilytica]